MSVQYPALVLVCDSCDASIRGDSVRDVRSEGRRQGWRRRNGRDLCPDCLREWPT